MPKSLNLGSQTLVLTTLYAQFRLAFHTYRLFLFLKRDETRQRSLVYDLIIYAISPVDDLTQGRNERAELALPLTRMPDNARLDTSRLNLA